jgi:ABC-2 type transport system ATP-binding protein
MDEATEVCNRLAIIVDGQVAALGEPEELIREYSATATVTFVTPDPVSVAELGKLGLVGQISTTVIGDETRVCIVTEDPDTILRRITFSPKLRAYNYRVQQGSLEDVFLDISNVSQSTGTP